MVFRTLAAGGFLVGATAPGVADGAGTDVPAGAETAPAGPRPSSVTDRAREADAVAGECR